MHRKKNFPDGSAALLMGRYRPVSRRRDARSEFTVIEARDTECQEAPVELRVYERAPGAAASGGMSWRRDARALSVLPDVAIDAVSAADADYIVLRPHESGDRRRRAEHRPGPSRAFIAALEMLVAVAVLLVFHLAVADAPTRTTRDRAQVQACLAARKGLATAIQMYRNESGVYPASLDVLVPRYVRAMPTCPRGGSYLGYPDDPQSWTCSRCSALQK